MDFASFEFMIFFDASFNLEFIESMKSCCISRVDDKAHVSRSVNDRNRSAIKPIIIREFLARICILLSMLSTPDSKLKNNPSAWRNFQLGKQFKGLVKTTGKLLWNQQLCVDKNLFVAIQYLFETHGINLALAIDQAGVLAQEGFNFLCNWHRNATSFLSAILEMLLKDTSFKTFIIAGTTLRLQSLDHGVSASLGKTTMQTLNLELIPITAFR